MKDAIPFYRVVCAIVQHPLQHDYFLVAQRGESDATLPGKWEFPGGKIEKGETETEALKREIREELDLEITVGKNLSSSFWTYPNFKIELIPYLCKTTTTTMQVLDHQQIAWVAKRDLLSMDWAPADIPIVEALLEH